MNKIERENVLFVTDHPELPSGVGTKTREIIEHTSRNINWTCIGGNSNPRSRNVKTYSSNFFESNVSNPHLKVYPHQRYGNYSFFRKVVEKEDIEKALFFGDPNNFYWLKQKSNAIDIPLFYYHVWDNLPVPEYNKEFYQSFDWIGAISLLTYHVLDQTYTGDYDYVPHGGDEDTFYPITENLSKIVESQQGKKTTDYQILENIKEEWLGEKDFVVFWCNRNIQRKNPSDVIRSFKGFVDEFPENRRDDFALIMKTNHKDPEGPHLPIVADKIAADCDIRILPEKVSQQRLNIYYNLADVTLNIANREGFGLTTLESLLAGTPIIVNVTGGLQDQCGFRDADGNLIDGESGQKKLQYFVDKRFKSCGKWVNPIWPETKTLSGTQQEPYCFDDYVSVDNVVSELKNVYMKGREARKNAGMKGRTFVMQHFSEEKMAKEIEAAILNKK